MVARRSLAAVVAVAALAGCTHDMADRAFTDFVVLVDDETFVVRAQDPDTIRLGFDVLNGRAQRFPIGSLVPGNGGFNAPWSWHVDPTSLRLTEVAIEVCDGRPSYVEAHVNEYAHTGYCPWGGRIIGVRP